MDRTRRDEVRKRARQIKKAQSKLTFKDYIQRALVVMVIVLILAAAMWIYNSR